MDSYQILKTIHKIGHPVTGTVIGYNQALRQVVLETSSDYKVVLPFDYIFDEDKKFEEGLIPKIGDEIMTVVRNHVEDTLYVSSRPKDLDPVQIQEFKDFYEFTKKNIEGGEINGIVKKVMPFGLFIDIDSQFFGLIDIGHSSFNKGEKLPCNYSEWPKEGDEIKCIIGYFRFHDRQIGLGWIPS